jgi:hypothetical protein
MNKILDNRMVRIMSYGVAGVFLVVHTAMYLLFRAYHVTPMAHFNACSICFYLAMFYVAHKALWRTYAVGVYLEVLLHMTGAVIFTGWDAGFQNTLIGINILIFYNEYVMRRLKQPHVKALPVALFGMLTYLFACIYAHHFLARYPLPESVCSSAVRPLASAAAESLAAKSASLPAS